MRNHFDTYIQNVLNIQRLTEPLFTGSKTDGSVYGWYRERAVKARTLFEENNAIIKEHILPILENPTLIEKEQVPAWSFFSSRLEPPSDNLLFDPVLAYRMRTVLLGYAQSCADDSLIVTQLCALLHCCVHVDKLLNREAFSLRTEYSSRYLRKGIDYGDQLSAYFAPVRFARLTRQAQMDLLHALRNRQLLYVHAPGDTHLFARRAAIAREAIAAPDAPHVHAVLTQDEHARLLLLAHREYSRLGREVDTRLAPRQLLLECVHSAQFVEAHRQELLQDPISAGEARLFLRDAEYCAGLITLEVLIRAYNAYYQKRSPRDYTLKGIRQNATCAARMLELIATSPDPLCYRELLTTLYQGITDYALHLKNAASMESFVEPAVSLLCHFVEYEGGMPFDHKAELMLANCHMPTYVHSLMVASLSQEIALRIIDHMPQYFVGVCGTQDATQVCERKEEILALVYRSGLLHDIGKLLYLHTFALNDRRLFEEEFDILQMHCDAGYRLLISRPSTAAYADAARGHHLFYDASHGYPNGFDPRTSPMRAVVSIVSVADCLDAATDTVFRTFGKGITVKEYAREVISQAGTRYSPYLAKFFKIDAFVEHVSVHLGREREAAYRKAFALYLRQLKTDVQQESSSLHDAFETLFVRFFESEDVCEQLRKLTLFSLSDPSVQNEYIPRFGQIAKARGYAYSSAVYYCMRFWVDHHDNLRFAIAENEFARRLMMQTPDYESKPGYYSILNNAVLGYSLTRDYLRAYENAILGLSLVKKEEHINFYTAFLNNTAIILCDVGLPQRALDHLRKSLALLDTMSTLNSTSTRYRIDMPSPSSNPAILQALRSCSIICMIRRRNRASPRGTIFLCASASIISGRMSPLWRCTRSRWKPPSMSKAKSLPVPINMPSTSRAPCSMKARGTLITRRKPTAWRSRG